MSAYLISKELGYKFLFTEAVNEHLSHPDLYKTLIAFMKRALK